MVERLVALACLAPSVHNTQPWLWRYRDDLLELRADLCRRLPAEDPRGRNLTISCGAALHHLQFAAQALGWESSVERIPLGAPAGVLARVRVHRTVHQAIARGDIDLMRSRRTDRRRFTARPVPADRLGDMCERTARWEVRAEAVTTGTARLRLELLADRNLGFLEAEGRRLLEQDRWIDRGRPDGIPLDHLPDDPDRLGARTRFRAGALEDTRLVIHGGERVVALGSSDDDVGGWLRTGEAMSDLWLEATRAGLSVVPMSQPIEVQSTRREIERTVLSGRFEPHLLLRVGWQPIGRRGLPRTPRRPVAEVLQR